MVYNRSLIFISRKEKNNIWPYLVLLRFCSVQVASTLLILIGTDNFSVKRYWRSLTIKRILPVLRDLKGDDSGEKETRVIIINFEDFVSL